MVSITPSPLCFTVDFAKGLSKRLCNTGPLGPSLAGTFERVLNKVFKCFCRICSFQLASERVKTGHLPYSVLLLAVCPWCNLECTVDCFPGDSEVPALFQDKNCQMVLCSCLKCLLSLSLVLVSLLRFYSSKSLHWCSFHLLFVNMASCLASVPVGGQCSFFFPQLFTAGFL